MLASLAEAARDDGLGVALVVDELQSVSLSSLGALVHVAQDLRDRLPFAFIGAGLPHLPSYIAKAATYTERFRYEPTDNLHRREAVAAVREPAAAEGVAWDGRAVTRVVDAAAGYPYFLQLYAYEAWESAARSGRVGIVGLADVAAGEPVARRQIEAGIYSARFEGATESERNYLFAMADLMADGDQVRSGEVARQLDRALSAVSPTLTRSSARASCTPPSTASSPSRSRASGSTWTLAVRPPEREPPAGRCPPAGSVLAYRSGCGVIPLGRAWNARTASIAMSRASRIGSLSRAVWARRYPPCSAASRPIDNALGSASARSVPSSTIRCSPSSRSRPQVANTFWSTTRASSSWSASSLAIAPIPHPKADLTAALV